MMTRKQFGLLSIWATALFIMLGCTPSVKQYTTQAGVAVPGNQLSGAPWELGILDAEALDALLKRPMPSPRDFDEPVDIITAIERGTQRKVVWVPPLTEENQAHLKEWRYEESTGTKPATVGYEVEGLLKIVTELGFHSPLVYVSEQEAWVTVAMANDTYLFFVNTRIKVKGPE